MDNMINSILNEADRNLLQENANLNGKTVSAKQNLIAGVALKEYALKLLPKDIKEAFEDGYIHIHDFDHYALGTTTCTQIELSKVLKGGWVTNGSHLREANSITVAMAHAAIIMQANQNQQHGGQAFPNWDFDLAPYVDKSYNKFLTKNLENGMLLKHAEDRAMEQVQQETDQAAEAFVHNMNTMNGSRGGQSVFSSINFGLDTSWQGRMVINSTLRAMLNGLGEGYTAIYPICIFKVKSGVNKYKGDPNYDLFKFSHYVTTKRLFPNYLNCDATFNINTDSDSPLDECAIMGCRTRVYENKHDITTPVGRGNNSFTTLNLPMIAQKADGDELKFIDEVTKYMKISIDSLFTRLSHQKNQLRSTFDFLYSQGSFRVTEDGVKVGDILDHNTLAVGFIGLAEAMQIIYPDKTYLDPFVQDKCHELISYMQQYLFIIGNKSRQNISLLATPSEGFAEKAMSKYVAKYGKFNDNSFFTNSFHVPVWLDCTASEKIAIEAPYHAWTPGGHISYVELSGEDAKDLDKVEHLVLEMMDANMGYASINTPVDKCLTCGHDDPITGDRCPKCGDANISRVRRITGYLVGDMSRWNKGKKDEESKRVKHKI